MPATQHGDIYAVGCVLYSIVFKKPVVTSAQMEEYPVLATDLLAGKARVRPPLAMDDSSVPPAVTRLIHSCLGEPDLRRTAKGLNYEILYSMRITLVHYL